MSDLRTAAQQARNALALWSTGRDMDAVALNDLIAELDAALSEPVQEPVAWRTFDGEGGYDYRTYEDNEDYAAEWAKRNPRHVGWVEPLFTVAQSIIQPEIKADKEPRLLPWKGLTEEEHTYYKACGFVGVKAVEEKLRARNSTLACNQGEEGK